MISHILPIPSMKKTDILEHLLDLFCLHIDFAFFFFELIEYLHDFGFNLLFI